MNSVSPKENKGTEESNQGSGPGAASENKPVMSVVPAASHQMNLGGSFDMVEDLSGKQMIEKAFHEAGYTVHTNKKRVRWFGNDLMAFDRVPQGEIGSVETIGVNRPKVEPKPGYEWIPIKMTPDSGACEHVGNPRQFASFGEVKVTSAVKQGVKYGTASGHSIPNLGQIDLDVITDDGANTQLSLQMADVTKTLLSVKRMTKAGNRVVFDSDGSYVQNKSTGFKTGIAEENGTYSMVVWTQARKGVKQFN